MALLTCAKCDLTVAMKRIDAKAHGWTSRLIPDNGEVWTCPRCPKAKAA